MRYFFFRLFVGLPVFFFSVETTAQSDTIKQRVTALSRAFAARTDSVIKLYFAEDFSVATYMGSEAVECLNAVLKTYHLDSLSFQHAEHKGAEWIVKVKIHGGKNETSNIYLNEQFQLLRIDLADLLYGMNRETTARQVAVIPFEESNGSIIITVTINESKRPLRLLFDTGADGMMLNKSLADSTGLKISHSKQASVVGGSINIEVSSNNNVHLNGFTLDKQSIAVFNKPANGTDGIIGNIITRRYITQVDYTRKEIILYSFGQFVLKPNERAIPVDVTTGNIRINATLSIHKDKPLKARFIFDTGAGYELIVFRPFVLQHKLLVDNFRVDSTSATTSLGVTSPVFFGKAAVLQIPPAIRIQDLPVALMGSGGKALNKEPGIDGSLGIHFISRYNFTINLMNKYVAISPNSRN
jgi:hypothetical protein